MTNNHNCLDQQELPIVVQNLSCNQTSTDSQRHIALARVFGEIIFFIQYYLKGLEKGKAIMKN